jgi:hypothetical protein
MKMSRSRIHSAAVPTADPAPVGQSWDVLLEHYRHRARQTLRTHRGTARRCSSCGQAWPCPRSLAAAFVLEL